MKRVCFLLQVQPDRLAEYRQRHKEVWPEMRRALQEAGWNNYSLFLREDGLLVGYLETRDFNAALAAMEKSAINARWQDEMAGFFLNPPGLGPDQAMVPLKAQRARLRAANEERNSPDLSAERLTPRPSCACSVRRSFPS